MYIRVIRTSKIVYIVFYILIFCKSLKAEMWHKGWNRTFLGEEAKEGNIDLLSLHLAE